MKSLNNTLFAIIKVSLYCLILIAIVGVLVVFVVIPHWVRTEEVFVPNVTGKSYFEAIRHLDEVGLKVADPVREASSEAKKGQIVSQKPPAHFRIKSHQTVELTVSIGAELEPVPSVIGKSVDAARETLAAARFLPNRIAYVHSLNYPPDIVIAQTPPEGGGQPRGSTVNLLVSLGKVMQYIQVPDLRNQSIHQVLPDLEAAGLNVEIQYSPHPKIPSGDIITHKPADGVHIQSGDLIVLEVSGVRDEIDITGRLLPFKHAVSEQGNVSHHVKIVVKDDSGERTVVDGYYAPGTVIDLEKQALRVFGQVRVITYENGNKLPEQHYR